MTPPTSPIPPTTGVAPFLATAVIETHVSTLFLTPDRVYKLLKPVDLGFLDHTTNAARIAAAGTELTLNRRIAPDVYLGLAEVHEGGEQVDAMVVMRRLPAERSLTRLVGTEGFADCVRAVARRIAAFHADQPPAADPSPARRDAVARNWDDNRQVIAQHPELIDPVDGERAARLAHAFLDHHEALFDSRIADGFVRDGHGDLLADDIFCLDDGPRILDCLAFREDLRIADVLCDIAFLAMDLHRLAGPAAARLLMTTYQEFGYEHHPSTLAHHYVAYRAHVRAKVACLRAAQGDPAAAALAGRYHDLCLHHLQRSQVHLVVVGGGAGVGKSTLANGLGDALGWIVLSSDEVRKNMAGLGSGTHAFAAPGEGIYTAEMTDAAYTELLHQAQTLLQRGESVILDATWNDARHRHQAAALAAMVGAAHHQVDCVLAPAVARERIARRMADLWNPSDATPETVDHLAAERDPWPGAVAVDMDQLPHRLVEHLAARLLALR